jgi:hypothetical protein
MIAKSFDLLFRSHEIRPHEHFPIVKYPSKCHKRTKSEKNPQMLSTFHLKLNSLITIKVNFTYFFIYKQNII